jgi:pilus assembly protein CpaB
MNRHALLGAFLAAALGAALLVLYLRRFEQEKSGGDPVKVLVLTKALARGKAVTDDILSVRDIPMAYVDDRTIKAAEREKVVGLRTIAPLDAQMVLMWNDLSVSVDDRRDLSSLITPGFRAVYIRAMREDQGSPLISPGDYVDVIATLPKSTDGREERTEAVVLLQKVLVLASGGRTTTEPVETQDKDKRTPPSREQGLTLSLSLPQAQQIALAGERGHFSVALRNPEDQRTFDGIPDMNESALVLPRSAPAVASRPTTPVRLRDPLVGGGTR